MYVACTQLRYLDVNSLIFRTLMRQWNFPGESRDALGYKNRKENR